LSDAQVDINPDAALVRRPEPVGRLLALCQASERVRQVLHRTLAGVGISLSLAHSLEEGALEADLRSQSMQPCSFCCTRQLGEAWLAVLALLELGDNLRTVCFNQNTLVLPRCQIEPTATLFGQLRDESPPTFACTS